MAQRRLLFHTACLTCKVTVGSVAAENVGSGRARRRIHRTMMRSVGHRANILSAFNQVGIGVEARGRLWVTEIFIS